MSTDLGSQLPATEIVNHEGVRIDEQTPHHHYPLPHPDNMLSADVYRLRTSFLSIDADIKAQEEKLRKLILYNKIDLTF
jgi:hypothetical protein